MVVPIKFNSFSMAIKAGIEIFQQLKKKLSTSGGFHHAPILQLRYSGCSCFNLKEQIMLDCLYYYTIFVVIRGSKLTTVQQVANLCYRYL